MLKSIRKFMKRFAGPNPFKVNNWDSNSNSNSNSNSPRRRKTPSPRKKTIRRKSV